MPDSKRQLLPIDQPDGNIRLAEWLNAKKPHSVHFYFDACMALLRATRDLHKQNRIYGDINPEFIIYDPIEKNASFVGDGFPAQVINNQLEVAMLEPINSGDFMAPELKLPQNDNYHYNVQTDVFALGMSIAKMLGIDDDSFETIFANDKIKTDIIRLIAEMVDEDPNNRPTIEDAISSLDRIINSYYRGRLNILSRIQNIVYLDVDMYLNANQTLRKKIDNELKNADEVQLYSSTGNAKITEAAQVKRLLENQAMAVHSTLLTNPEKKPMKAVIDEHTGQLEKENERIYIAYNVVNGPSKDDATSRNVIDIVYKDNQFQNTINNNNAISLLAVHPSHIQMILKSLDNQRSVLVKRAQQQGGLDPRAFIIGALVAKLKQQNQIPLSYGDMLDLLKNTERDLINARKPSVGKYMEKFFGLFKSSTTQMVHDVSEKVKNDINLKR